ncbi:MAG: YqzL family protein [Clostridia bacterium]|nr:YqzL family protein [Clostridia bacterium]
MIKKIAWETFKNTGDINAFIELKQIEDIEKGIENNNFKSDITENKKREQT